MALEVGLIGNGGTGGVETPPHKRGGTEGGEGCGGNGGWGNGAEMVTLERKGERTEGGDAREVSIVTSYRTFVDGEGKPLPEERQPEVFAKEDTVYTGHS